VRKTTAKPGKDEFHESPSSQETTSFRGTRGARPSARMGLLTSPRDGRQRGASSPSPLNGESIRRTSSRLEPLNPVGTRSTASPSSGLQWGTQWNASLPVPAGRFMGRAGVRGEKLKKRPISWADLRDDRPHLTLPSPLPPGAEREDGRPLVVHPTARSVALGTSDCVKPRPDTGQPRPPD
jgi:hypothetical protein